MNGKRAKLLRRISGLDLGRDGDTGVDKQTKRAAYRKLKGSIRK